MRGLLLLAGLSLPIAACSSVDNGNDSQIPTHDIAIVKNAATLGANAFSPANLTFSLAQKTKVIFFNGDITSGSYGGGGSTGTSHRLISDDGTTFHSSTLAPGDVFSPIFHITGTFTYHCEIHPTMTGTITVNP